MPWLLWLPTSEQALRYLMNLIFCPPPGLTDRSTLILGGHHPLACHMSKSFFQLATTGLFTSAGSITEECLV